jgi:hypothetical protein
MDGNAMKQKSNRPAKLPPFYKRHRGPYVLCLTRQNDDGEFSSHWLKTEIKKGPDVETQARAMLANRRDTVVSVCVWSRREEQFVWSVK